MSPNAAIAQQAWAVMRGDAQTGVDDRPGMCLSWVRQVLERALNMRSHELYEEYVTTWVQPAGYPREQGHWARDAEKSLRDLGMALAPGAEAMPGDLVFNYRAAWSDRWGAYIGHVGILLDRDWIAENIRPAYRPGSLTRGALALTPASAWASPTTIIRFDPDKKAR